MADCDVAVSEIFDLIVNSAREAAPPTVAAFPKGDWSIPLLMDVRDVKEAAQGRIPSSVVVPESELGTWALRVIEAGRSRLWQSARHIAGNVTHSPAGDPQDGVLFPSLQRTHNEILLLKDVNTPRQDIGHNVGDGQLVVTEQFGARASGETVPSLRNREPTTTGTNSSVASDPLSIASVSWRPWRGGSDMLGTPNGEYEAPSISVVQGPSATSSANVMGFRTSFGMPAQVGRVMVIPTQAESLMNTKRLLSAAPFSGATDPAAACSPTNTTSSAASTAPSISSSLSDGGGPSLRPEDNDSRSQPIITYCHSGIRASRAAKQLRQMGFQHVRCFRHMDQFEHEMSRIMKDVVTLGGHKGETTSSSGSYIMKMDF